MIASQPATGRSQAQAASLFETPLIIDQVTDPETLNALLRDAIIEQMGATEGLAISNIGGWHSGTNMLDWGGEPANQLCSKIVDAVDRFTVDIRAGESRRHGWLPEMWANVSPSGASNRHHCHPGSYWSAVYYVDDGYEGSLDRSLGGELVLYDPRMPMVRMTAPDLRFRRPGAEPEHDEVRLRPATGRIVIFPSWLNHSVAEFRGSGTRISIAVNLTPGALPPGSPLTS
jgi:uncharacterized protein (TIGR02466 family)